MNDPEDKILSELKSNYAQISDSIPNVKSRTNSYITHIIHRNELPFSNLLSYYLDEHQDHGFGSLFLDTLLKMVYLKNKAFLDSDDYGYNFKIFGVESYSVTTEEFAKDLESGSETEKKGRIDILIKSKSKLRDSSWAIIIENKIDNFLGNDLNVYWNHVSKEYRNAKLGIILSLKSVEFTHLGFFNVTLIDYCNLLKQKIFDYSSKATPQNFAFLIDFFNYVDELYCIQPEIDETICKYVIEYRKLIFQCVDDFNYVNESLTVLKNIELLKFVLSNFQNLVNIQNIYALTCDHVQTSIKQYINLNNLNSYTEGKKNYFRGKDDCINNRLIRYTINWEDFVNGRNKCVEILLSYSPAYFNNLPVKFEIDTLTKICQENRLDILDHKILLGWKEISKIKLSLNNANDLKYFSSFLEQQFHKIKLNIEQSIFEKINNEIKSLFNTKTKYYFDNCNYTLTVHDNQDIPDEVFFYYDLHMTFAMYSIKWLNPLVFQLSLWLNEDESLFKNEKIIEYGLSNNFTFLNEDSENYCDINATYDYSNSFKRFVEKKYDLTLTEFNELDKYYNSIRDTWVNYEILVKEFNNQNYPKNDYD